MNENHHRHLVSTFQYVDNQLSQMEHIMALAGSTSPFQEHSQDTTPVQRKVIHDYIVAIRQTMCGILAELKLPLKQPICGATWAARGHVSFAQIGIAEIAPERMRGYGQLWDTDRQLLGRILGQLNAELSRLSKYLADGEAADLQTRIGRLEQTLNEVKLLGELDRIVTAHGLVEFRNPVGTLVDRLETVCFEIGVFGRVSSGKSSLLNHLLDQPALPVGVTPVTAVPTRISFGPRPHAIIEFADAKPQNIELSRLAEFSTEQQNPGNAKHVTRIVVGVPSRRLQEGVVFVDTPGLGSLATTGAEETLAYLPKCDLGIVLLDAGAALSHEDLVVIQSLYRSGATALVLISKADLLSAADREKTADYVHEHLSSQLNLNLPVHLVSVVGPDAQLCDEWFENTLKPLLDSHNRAAATSIRRKIGLLREAVMDTLCPRLNGTSDPEHSRSSDLANQAVEALRGADAILESAEEHGRVLGHEFGELALPALQTAATEIAAAWLNGTQGEEVRVLSVSLNRFLAQQSRPFVESVEALASRLSAILQEAHAASGLQAERPEALPRAKELPIFDTISLATAVHIHRPLLLQVLGRRVLQRVAQSKLLDQIGDSLIKFFSSSGRQLEQWHRNALLELRSGFDAQAGIYRAMLSHDGTLHTGNTPASEIQADFDVLAGWADQDSRAG